MGESDSEKKPASVDQFEEPVDEEDSQQETERLRRRYLLSRFWRTARAFWSGHRRAVAWGLTVGLLVVVLLNIAASYGMNLWNRAMFDALQNKNGETVLFLSFVYFVLLAASVGVHVAQVYGRMTLQRTWRRWFTDSIIDRWLTAGHYYQLNLVSGEHQNPEYRMADDVRIATEAPVDFFTGVLQAFLSPATFSPVLWTIGGSLDFTIAGVPIHVPGFLVVAAVFYAVLASGSMALIGRRFVIVSGNKNQIGRAAC